MTNNRAILYIHGVGGGNPKEEWFTPLNARLRQVFETEGFEIGLDSIVDVDYSAALRDPTEVEMPRTIRRRFGDEGEVEARAEYDELRAQLAQQLAPLNEARGWMGSIPAEAASAFAPVIRSVLKDARLYGTSKQSRAAVLREVLDAVSRVGPHRSVTVIAHSLGSVVLADAIPRMPLDLRLDVVTIGSPLTVSKLWPSAVESLQDFSYGRVRSWVNIFGLEDPVASGRGLTGLFPQVVDVGIDIGKAHTVAAYASHESTARAVSLQWGRTIGAGDSLPARPINPAWDLQLLGFAFTNQLSASCASTRWKFKRTLDSARVISAARLLTEVVDGSNDPSLPVPRPTESDLLHRAADLVRDKWLDEELVPICISLLFQPPLPPFDIDFDDELIREGIEALLDRVRQRSGNLTDKRFAKALIDASESVKKDFKSGGGGRGVMIGVGLIVLAATGVGLVAAVPAGLAGAAAITSTLAAFGPGGMVGGMVALTALTGTGSALVGAGLAPEGDEWHEVNRKSVESLATLGSNELESTIVPVLAVVEARSSLGFRNTAAQVERLLIDLQARLAEEFGIHSSVAPNRPRTKDLKRRLDVVTKALSWLSTRLDPATFEFRNALQQAYENEE